MDAMHDPTHMRSAQRRQTLPVLRVSLLAIVAAAVPACHPGGGLPQPPYAPRTSADGKYSGDSASTQDRRPFAEVAEARGMPPLRAVVLPEGTREVRIAESYGMIAGEDIPFLRIVEQPGGITGELLLFRAETRDAGASVSPGCAPLRDSMQTCVRVAEVPGIAWDTVAARLDSLGVWTLSEPCEQPLRWVFDAGDLLIQRLEGARFTSYSCNAPRYNVEREAGRRSLEIWNYVRALARAARR